MSIKPILKWLARNLAPLILEEIAQKERERRSKVRSIAAVKRGDPPKDAA